MYVMYVCMYECMMYVCMYVMYVCIRDEDYMCDVPLKVLGTVSIHR